MMRFLLPSIQLHQLDALIYQLVSQTLWATGATVPYQLHLLQGIHTSRVLGQKLEGVWHQVYNLSARVDNPVKQTLRCDRYRSRMVRNAFARYQRVICNNLEQVSHRPSKVSKYVEVLTLQKA